MSSTLPTPFKSTEYGEIFSKRVHAGRRTYFFDVKTTRSGEDYFITITESRRQDDQLEKHRVFLYKEDFGKFAAALHEAIDHIRDNYLPDFDYRELAQIESSASVED